MLKILLTIVLLITTGVALFGAWIYPTPYAASYQDRLDTLLWGGSILLIVLSSSLALFSQGSLRFLNGLVLAGGILALGMMIKQAYQFHQWQQTVLSTDPALLQKLGKHFVIGYRDEQEIETLAAAGAIAGVYITNRNIQDKSVEDIRRYIDHLQSLRKANKLPPLIICADQEGGIVSRMSPPLAKQTTLAKSVTPQDENQHEQLAYDYGKQQGKGLASLGITINLSPVVDLIPERTSKTDRFSLIYRRAISKSPEQVAKVATAYVKGLESEGVLGTLKHFPGLGGVYGDTHLESATLDTPIAELNARDWLPFKHLAKSTQALIMVGHINLSAIDPTLPTSLSKKVIQTIIRDNWQFNGTLITDDLTMDAVYKIEDNHLQNVASTALDAGIDLLLISYDVRQFYPAMAGLIKDRQNTSGDAD